jgi:hypothetical protein
LLALEGGDEGGFVFVVDFDSGYTYREGALAADAGKGSDGVLACGDEGAGERAAETA